MNHYVNQKIASHVGYLNLVSSLIEAYNFFSLKVLIFQIKTKLNLFNKFRVFQEPDLSKLLFKMRLINKFGGCG